MKQDFLRVRRRGKGDKSMSKNVIIYGVGSLGKILYHYLKSDSEYFVTAFCVDEKYLNVDKFCGLPVVPFESINNLYPPSEFMAITAIGYSNMRVRKIMYEKLKASGYKCINFIHSSSTFDKTFSIGDNNIILQNNSFEPFVRIGNNNIFWSSTTISHDVEIGSHSFFASQTLIGGFTKIRNNCFFGFNSNILQDLIVENESLIGSNSTIIKSTSEFGKYLGTPAELISVHKEAGIKIND